MTNNLTKSGHYGTRLLLLNSKDNQPAICSNQIYVTFILHQALFSQLSCENHITEMNTLPIVKMYEIPWKTTQKEDNPKWHTTKWETISTTQNIIEYTTYNIQTLQILKTIKFSSKTTVWHWWKHSKALLSYQTQ